MAQQHGQAGGVAGNLRSIESMLAEGGTAAQLQPYLGQMLAASQLAGLGGGDQQGGALQEAFNAAGMHQQQPGAHGGPPGQQPT